MSEGEKLVSEAAAKPLAKADDSVEATSNTSQKWRIGRWVAISLVLISGMALAPWIGGASELGAAKDAAMPRNGDVENATATSASPEQAVTYSALVDSGEGIVLSASAPDYSSLPWNNDEGFVEATVQAAAELAGGIGNGRFGGSASAGGSAARGTGGGSPLGAGFPSASRPGGGPGTGNSSEPPSSPSSPDSPTKDNPDTPTPTIVGGLPPGPTGEEPGKGPSTPPYEPGTPLPNPEGPLPPAFLTPGNPASTGPETIAAVAEVPAPGTALLILLGLPLLLTVRRRSVPRHV